MLIASSNDVKTKGKICDGCGLPITKPPLVMIPGKGSQMFFHMVCASHIGQRLANEVDEFTHYANSTMIREGPSMI